MPPFSSYTFPVETVRRKRNWILNHQVSATFLNCRNTLFHPVFLTELIVVSVSICEIACTVSQETIHGFQQIRYWGANNHTTVRSMNKNQTLLEINAAIAAMIDSNRSYLSARPSYMKGVFCWRYNSVPLIRRLSVTPYTICLFVTHIYGLFCAHIYMRVFTHKAGKNASIRDKKTHVYSVAGMIASIRGKKTHVYRVIILKQTADHTLGGMG